MAKTTKVKTATLPDGRVVLLRTHLDLIWKTLMKQKAMEK
jgi:hypothetical protein